MQNFLKKYRLRVMGAAIFAGLIGFFLVYILYLMPLPEGFSRKSYPTTKIYDRRGELLYEVLIPDEGKKSLIDLKRMPQALIQATISVEDSRFFEHGGIDWRAVARALYLNLKEARIVSGGSTITQQLARNLIGTKQKRSFFNKIKESLCSLRLERVYSKNEILELYLNKVYYGNLAYGIEAAAQDYFGKHVYDLDLAEIALLAGLPQSPSNYNPFQNTAAAKKRQTYVLDLMVKNGYVEQVEAEAAAVEPLKFRRNRFVIKAPHFVHFVLNQLEQQYSEELVHFGGLEVITTLDLTKQRQAEEILETQLEFLKKNKAGNGAVLTLTPETNEILVWVGSQSYFDESIDGAVDMLLALRQPGSALKPFTYWAAFLKGYTPATTVSDIYTQFATESGFYTPKNYDLDYHGLVRLRDALGSSLNIPAVKVLEYVGVPNFLNFLKKIGISSLNAGPVHYGLALTLGGGEVRPLELASAYSVLANYGVKKELRFIREIRDQEGRLIYQPISSSRPVLGEKAAKTAYQIIDILSDSKARLIGFGEDTVLELTHPAAVKTGTTRSFRDNWTVGFTTDYLTLVWVGNADGSAMDNISGITGAAPIWHTIMESLLRLEPKRDFWRPPGLNEVEICRVSGMLPSAACTDRMKELFVSGTEPTKIDRMVRRFKIDRQRNRVIALDCPESLLETEERVFVVYPPDLRRWAMSKNIPQPPNEVCGSLNWETDDFDRVKNFDNNVSIRVSYPENGDSFLIDRDVPLNGQKIPFRVDVSRAVTTVRWSLEKTPKEIADSAPSNAVLLGESKEFPFTYLWDIPVDEIRKKGAAKFRIYAEALLKDGKKVLSEAVVFEMRY